MKGCTSRCDAKALQAKEHGGEDGELIGATVYNDCVWICYNKLDRRYIDYWKKKRDSVIQRHAFNLAGASSRLQESD